MSVKRERDVALQHIFAKRGAAVRIATEIGITPQAVSNWKIVPAERVLDVERVTGVPRHVIRPDIYPPHEKDMAQGAEAAA